MFATIYIYETTWLRLFETAFKRLVLPPSGPDSYYMIILFPSGKNACLKYRYKRFQLGTECGRGSM